MQRGRIISAVRLRQSDAIDLPLPKLPRREKGLACMKKERFQFVCNESNEGRDAFVVHEAYREEGRVMSCSTDHVVVLTSDGKNRCWDFQDCTELSRSAEEWPWR
jgi:hypothetical protein